MFLSQPCCGAQRERDCARGHRQNAPISVLHFTDLAEPLGPLRWAVGDPMGAKGLKETCCGVEEEEEEEEEEDTE